MPWFRAAAGGDGLRARPGLLMQQPWEAVRSHHAGPGLHATAQRAAWLGAVNETGAA